MKYEKTVTGIFVDRPNRFIAHVQIENQLQTVHVKIQAVAKNSCYQVQQSF